MTTKKFIITRITNPEELRTIIFFDRQETNHTSGSTGFDGELTQSEIISKLKETNIVDSDTEIIFNN